MNTITRLHIIFCSLGLAATALPAAEYRYQDPAAINLATIRGVKATASQNLKKGQAVTVLHNSPGDVYFVANGGRCWWMMEFPEEVSVSSVCLAFGRQIQSVGFRVKGASQALDDAHWEARPPLRDYNGQLPQTDDYFRWAACEFAATRVKFLRIEFYGHNGSEQPGKGVASTDLVFHNIQVRGAENPVIGPAISSAQSACAGGRCTLDDASTSSPRDCPGLIDDGEKGYRDLGDYNVTFYVKDGRPCNVIVKLKHRSKVSAAAFVTHARESGQRPRDMNIYTSAEEIGEHWTLQKELRDIAAGGYVETEFGNPVLAKRVRFEITRVWNTAIDKKRDASWGKLAEMYVYGVPGSPLPTDFSYTLRDAAMVGCQIIDDSGKPVRTMDAVPMKPGTWLQEWDGLNDQGERLPAKSYRCRIVINPAVYTHVGNIGNNAVPSTVNQNPFLIESIVIDREGNVFSANDWEEAGQNIRKWAGSDGRHMLHAMTGHTPPSALPYGIAVDEKYVYCTAYTVGNKIPFTQHDVRRYRVTDGSWAAFPDKTATNGHIAICKDPSKNLPEGTPAEDRVLMGRWPLRAIVVDREKIFVTDAFAGKIRSFNKETGEPAATFDVKLPHALAIDAQERLWVGHQHGKVTVFGKDGSLLKQVLGDLGHCGTLAFGPGNRLFVADTVAKQVKIYEVDFAKLQVTFLKTFGQPAKPGDFAPDRFYSLNSFGVDAQGNMFAAQMFPLAGARLTKFSADGTVLWDQYGSEFCSTGNYSSERPDDIISQFLNRYRVDKSTGEVAFRGFVYDGDERFLQFGKRGSVTRFLKLGTSEFLFQGNGDGLRVLRHEKGLYRLAAMFGMKNPMPDGRYWNDLPGTAEEKKQKYPTGLWSFHDANSNGLVDETEITWAIKPGEKVQISHFGTTVDDQGNALFCEHNRKNVMEVPLTGFDALGNPIYGTDAMKEVVPPEKMPADKKRIMSQPLMAVRAEDGTIYVQGRSEVYPAPPEVTSMAWMAGWVLARYDRNGTMLWHRPLPEGCPGMDRVPGGGVMLVAVKWEKGGCPIYHYTPDGILIGMAKLSPRFLNPVGAGPDNVGSLCVSRDPRDGQLDLFAEDCLGNRFYWHRVDDRKPLEIITGTLGTKAGQP